MLQRSFRLSEASLTDLQRVADYLAGLNPARRAPNQTTALAWCIARGLDAVEAAEAKAAKQDRDPQGIVAHELKAMQTKLSEVVDALWRDRNARESERRELERHRRRVPELETLIARPDAGGRWAEVDDQGVVYTCEGEPGNVTKRAERREVRVSLSSSEQLVTTYAKSADNMTSHAEVASRVIESLRER